MRLYLNERKLRDIGFDEPMIVTFRKLTQFLEAQEALAAAQADIVTTQGQVDAATATITTLTAAVNTLDARADALEAAGPYVVQDGAAAPAYSAYAGQAVSAGYVQAEAQATDNAVAALGTAVATLITRLQTANVLT